MYSGRMRAVIVGGGVVGFGIGIALAKKRGAQVTILEERELPFTAASGRNSGVIHSGIYYSNESLKRELSVRGNEKLKALARDHSIALISEGKLIVSKSDDDEGILDRLEKRADENGVPVRREDGTELPRYSANLRTHKSFLFVESTAVADVSQINEALMHDFCKLGGTLKLGCKVTAANWELFTRNADIVVNACGAGALALAQSRGIGLWLSQTMFLGTYIRSVNLADRFNYPVYPVPDPDYPFLGVHITPQSSGQIKVGPSAVPLLYDSDFRAVGWQIRNALISYSRLAKRDLQSLMSLAIRETPKMTRRGLIACLNEIADIEHLNLDWQFVRGPSRAQLVDSSGQMVDDFIVQSNNHEFHILNAVSPGWTSSLSFGDYFCDSLLS